MHSVLLVRVHGFFCPLGCVRHIFCFQGRDTTGAFLEIAPVVSHHEIYFSGYIFVFKSETPLVHFSKMPQWCLTVKNNFRSYICIFRGETPLGRFPKLPQWCLTTKFIFETILSFSRVRHHWGIFQYCPSGVSPRNLIFGGVFLF